MVSGFTPPTALKMSIVSLSLPLCSVDGVVGSSAWGVKGHRGSEEWAVNDRKIPHTFSTRSTQNTDLSCPPWVLTHRRH